MVSKWSAVCPAHHGQQRLMIEAPLAHRTPARRAIACAGYLPPPPQDR